MFYDVSLSKQHCIFCVYSQSLLVYPYDSPPCSIICNNNNINICQVVPVDVRYATLIYLDMLPKILRMFGISGCITFCLGIALLNSWHCHIKLAVCVVDTILISRITAMLCYATKCIVTISINFQLLLYPIATYPHVPYRQSNK